LKKKIDKDNLEKLNEPLEKKIKMTLELAMLEAKIHDTYIVYMDEDGYMVRKYPVGKIERY
jgi:hypothetical protein